MIPSIKLRVKKYEIKRKTGRGYEKVFRTK